MADEQLAALNPVLYLCHLPPSLPRSELYALILPFARPISVQLPLSSPFANQGYAYVCFQSLADTQRARKYLNGVLIRNCTITTSLYLQGKPMESANVFVKNLPTSYTPAMLEDLFDPESVILSSKISVDEANQSLGYGYVQFLEEDMAGKAIRDLNGVRVGSRPITVESFVKKTKRTIAEGHTIFVKGFGPSFTEFHLSSIFSSFGAIRSIILRRVPGFSFAFVTFRLRSSAESAIHSLHSSEGPGFTWFCSFRVPEEGRIGCDLTRDDQWRQSRILVTNFPKGFEEADLRRLFTPFGRIISVKFGSKTTELGPVDAALVVFSSDSEVEDAFAWGKSIRIEGKPIKVEKTTRDFAKKPLFPPFDLSEFCSQSGEEGKRECLEGYVRIAVERIARQDLADKVTLEMVRMHTQELVRVVSDANELERVVRILENCEETDRLVGQGEVGDREDWAYGYEGETESPIQE